MMSRWQLGCGTQPDVGWQKAARLLRPRGWLALLDNRETYDEPFGSALTAAWIKRSEDGGAWATTKKRSLAETFAETRLFEPAIENAFSQRVMLPSELIVRRELTRATSLSWEAGTRAAFMDELRRQLEQSPEIGLEQYTQLTMAQVRAD